MAERNPECLQFQDDIKRSPFLTACQYGCVKVAAYLIKEYNVNIQGDPEYV